MVTVFVPNESLAGERRVAATPETVKRFVGAGADVAVEAGAGEGSRIADDAYVQAGATVVGDPAEQWAGADLVCTVVGPREDQAKRLAEGAVLLGFLAPHRNLEVVRTLAERKVAALAMELVPRISRAQRMDALSSQAALAGYRAVIMAAHSLEKQFPLSMTAAGTIRPAQVVVLGAGVAGLQAIATAHRLGAVVRVSDIREAAKGEVESLGAEFIELPEMGGEGEGGYARAVGADFLTRQREILTGHLRTADAVIATAVVPGRPAPTLVTEEMVDEMKTGAVLIDLAAPEGGNCALTEPDREVEHGGVRIRPAGTLAATVPTEASPLYARNVWELSTLLVEEGRIRVDRDDEIIAVTLVTVDGEVVHAPTADALSEATR